MRKIITIICSCIVLAFISYFVFRINKIIQHKRKVERNSAQLPNFSFYRINDETYSKSNLPDEKATIIFNLFNPTCEHCQYMATQYVQNKQKLKKITILMITKADRASVVKFYEDYQLNSMPNIVMLRDPQYKFYKIFGTGSVPCFFVYKNKVLVKKIVGETKINNLLN